jgi:hypothetical protein
MITKFALSVGLFLTSAAHASVCNIAVVTQSGSVSDTASAAIDLSEPSFSLLTPSTEYKAEVLNTLIGGKEFRNVVLRSQSGYNYAAALFLPTNDHPFLSMKSNGVLVQFQCWLELDPTL